MKLSVASRSSSLARAQVKEVYLELKQFYPDLEFSCTFVETVGDLDRKTSLRNLNKTDFFTREVDRLQLEGKCRIAIHSAKDLPDPITKGLKVAAITRGIDASDSLVLRHGESLFAQAVVATSSVHREEAVKLLRTDLTFVDLRGTIGERLQRLFSHEVDGVVVAEAALIRLGLTHLNRLTLLGETTPLQGKLAITSVEDDHEICEFLSVLEREVVR